MAWSHTKDKGDLGVAKAFADLVERGFIVLLPATEHSPFDLVTYRDDQFLRVQVKYRSSEGRVVRDFRLSLVGQARSPPRANGQDLRRPLCVYCPDTDKCYYVRPEDYPDRSGR